MINIVIGIILLLMVLVDYYIMKPFDIDCGFRGRNFMLIVGLLNLISGIWL